MQRCFDTCNFDKVRFLKEMYQNLLEAILKTDIFGKLLRNKFNQGDENLFTENYMTDEET